MQPAYLPFLCPSSLSIHVRACAGSQGGRPSAKYVPLARPPPSPPTFIPPHKHCSPPACPPPSPPTAPRLCLPQVWVVDSRGRVSDRLPLLLPTPHSLLPPPLLPPRLCLPQVWVVDSRGRVSDRLPLLLPTPASQLDHLLLQVGGQGRGCG